MVVQPDQENCKDYEDDDEEEEKEEEGTLDQTAFTKADDNSSLSDSLDTQDSVVRTFDPASIQVKEFNLLWRLAAFCTGARFAKKYQELFCLTKIFT